VGAWAAAAVACARSLVVVLPLLALPCARAGGSGGWTDAHAQLLVVLLLLPGGRASHWGNPCWNHPNACCAITPDANGHVDVPEGTTSIAQDAYASCIALKSISLPASLTSIERYTFRSTGLTSVDLSGTAVTSIEDSAFWGTSSLLAVSFPATLQSVGMEAFYSSGLISVDLSGTAVTSIELGAFAGTSIGIDAFAYTS